MMDKVFIGAVYGKRAVFTSLDYAHFVLLCRILLEVNASSIKR